MWSFCVPSIITEVEERAVIDAGIAGGRKARFSGRGAGRGGHRRGHRYQPEPTAIWWSILAAARPMWRLFSLGGIVESTSIKVAGDKFDEAIVKYVRRKHNALIGDRTAEEIKRTVGLRIRAARKRSWRSGRCLMTGLPRTFTVSSSEILDALEEVPQRLSRRWHWVAERTPPELTGDISANGITMTGGGSLIWGFDKLIASKTGIPTRVADEAVSCVAYGTGNCLENLSKCRTAR